MRSTKHRTPSSQRSEAADGRRIRAFGFRPAFGLRVSVLGFVAAMGLWLSPLFASPAQPTPLVHAHAHNDYQHERPLLDALDRGFCSVEADVHLVNGELLVAHARLLTK